ncbi:MAG: hypothetical protein ACKOOC_08070 [Cyanobium sp.]
MRFTPAQRVTFIWDETEQQTFRTDFRANVLSTWSGRYPLVTT